MRCEKAEGQSISFRPGWLYHEAKKYGAQLTDADGNATPQNVSEVVCGFVRAGLLGAGWKLPDSAKKTSRPISRELERALTEVRQLGGDAAEILRAAIPALTTKQLGKVD